MVTEKFTACHGRNFVDQKRTGAWVFVTFMLSTLLLAKQGWRLITEPDSLISRVLTAKYFPNSSFMNIKVNPHASASWKSLCATRQIIDRDCIVNKVADLLHSESPSWNVPILQTLFFAEEVDLIRSLPFSLRRPRDQLIWHYDTKGLFTVKSAYCVAQTLMLYNETVTAPSSSSNADSSMWPTLWKSLIPWTATSPVVPGSPLGIKRSLGAFSSVRDLLYDYAHNYAAFDFSSILMMGWTIWEARNALLCNNKRSDPALMWTKTKSRLNEFIQHQMAKGPRAMQRSINSKWCEPKEGEWKVNLDGSWDKDSQVGGAERELLVLKMSSLHYTVKPLRQEKALSWRWKGVYIMFVLRAIFSGSSQHLGNSLYIGHILARLWRILRSSWLRSLEKVLPTPFAKQMRLLTVLLVLLYTLVLPSHGLRNLQIFLWVFYLKIVTCSFFRHVLSGWRGTLPEVRLLLPFGVERVRLTC
ncbi:PREDICTED: reverse mRNAase [Prunus dulcis]|uniref:PREDICTED: reverse mRNAase n=1 Tax=Prunus dulcis TaxID=3755 RepID=A0A5E4FJ96_PRUDU|nr:PREDICTED: reverse mRNAase [Prunus dulcis]